MFIVRIGTLTLLAFGVLQLSNSEAWAAPVQDSAEPAPDSASEELVPLERFNDERRAVEPLPGSPAPRRTAKPSDTPTASSKVSSTEPSCAADWFFNLGASYGAVIYGPFYQAIATYQAAQGGAGYVFGGDLGVYHSFLARNTMLGLAGRGIMDFHPGLQAGFASVAPAASFIYQGSIVASAMQFLGQEPATGFFIRADLGYSFVGVGSAASVSSSTGILSGMGVLGGLGYSMDLARHIRLLLGGQISSILFMSDTPLLNFQGNASFMLAF